MNGLNEKKVLKDISKLQKKGLNPPNLPFFSSLVVFFYTNDDSSQKKFEKKIILFIIKELVPFCFVEGPYFKIIIIHSFLNNSIEAIINE
jgi:hypothetical protein